MSHNHRPAARYTGDETQARAGEAGEGFAVVADEVKSLAEESQDHASDIERMVDELVEQAEQMADGAESVAAANEQQSAKVREINDTVQRLTEE